MVRALISHAYFQVTKDSHVELSLDDELNITHWIVMLKEEIIIPKFQKFKKLLSNDDNSENEGENKSINDNVVSNATASVLNKKKNVQKSERHHWKEVKNIIKERVKLERKVLDNRKLQRDLEY